jgi:uncharacterized protein (TIGR02231 family)
MRRLLPTLVLVSLAAALPAAIPAVAADTVAASAVTAVTVYSDRARVTRTAAADLKAGDATVVIGGLPASAAADSVQVAGSADYELTIVSVESRQVFRADAASERERAIQADLQAATDRHQAIADKISALDTQADFIQSVAKVSPPKTKEGILLGKPADWSAAWVAVGRGMDETLKSKREQEIALRAAAADVRRLEQELARVRTGVAQTTEVKVQARAGAAGTAHFAVTYEVPDASWAPVYDARLDPEKGDLDLTLRGEVRQQTGEDWDGAQLTLSTAHPAAAAMPEPEPWFVGFEHPVATDFFRKSIGKEETMKSAGIAGALDNNLRDLQVATPAREAVATADVGEFALTYHVAGTQTVPADGEPHAFVADRRTFPAHLQVRTHPVAEPVAYLYAVLTNDGAPLPGGRVSLYRSGVLVGQSAMDPVRPGEERRLAFGADDRVRVSRAVDTDQAGKSGLFGGKRRIERRYVIEVGNFHAHPVEVSVYDRVPVARDEAIEVKYLDDWATAPSETDVEGDKGVVVWTGSFEGGEKRKIRFGYALTFPKDERLAGF